MKSDFSLGTLVEISAAIEQGQLSCAKLVETSLEQIERRNGGVNAVVSIRANAARREANAADAVDPKERGALHGIPILVKDLNETLDLPTTYGSRALAGRMAKFEAEAVSRLKAAGAIVVGKTNTPEFGLRPTTENGVYGVTRNPFNLEHTSGGSSGGAAAALATGMVPIAPGGDGGGSCRIPASCCSVVGMKPSRGQVTWAPIAQEYWAALATNGPMARSVADVTTLLGVMAGSVTGEPYGVSVPSKSAIDNERPLRIGVCITPPHGRVDEEVIEAVRRAAEALHDIGHRVDDYDLDLSGLYDHWLTVVEANTAMTVEHVVGDAGLAKLEANTLALAMRGRQKSAADYAFAVHAMRNRSAEIMQAADEYDVILTPTLTATAPPVEQEMDTETHEVRWARYLDWLAFTYPINCTGQPALSIPGGLSRAGLPIGVQLIGRMGDDAGVLTLGTALEAVRPWRENYYMTIGGSQ